ncbi:MAG: PilZ domain-containing protein [Candidatus Omnitrophica bacterium]|nr:PilZ domain-containing protein [Candidatus Omnitrophota bacterium]MDD5487972.1 PilZ domain-containing protein [Candidatus Omnitrophota bacterium]
MKQKLPERRRFLRVNVPLNINVSCSGVSGVTAQVKNVSPVGLGIEILRELKIAQNLDLELFLPGENAPVVLKGIVAWQAKKSLEDSSPYDVGIEIMDISDRDKNKFLKYLCDLLYGSVNDVRC